MFSLCGASLGLRQPLVRDQITGCKVTDLRWIQARVVDGPGPACDSLHVTHQLYGAHATPPVRFLHFFDPYCWVSQDPPPLPGGGRTPDPLCGARCPPDPPSPRGSKRSQPPLPAECLLAEDRIYVVRDLVAQPRRSHPHRPPPLIAGG